MKSIKWALLVAGAVIALGVSQFTAFAQPDDFSDAPPPPSLLSPAPDKTEPQKEDYLFNIAEEKFKKGDYKKAFLIFDSLSYDGHVESILYMAAMYERGLGVPKSSSKALKIYKRAARLGSDSGKKAYERLSKE